MALNAATTWEVRTTGSDNSGGGFRDGASGTDYSQQNAAQKSGTDLAIHASDATKVRPVAAGVSANDIGNLIQIRAGTGFTTGFYEITAQDGTYWTLDRAAGTLSSSGGTYAMGGALASPGKVGGAIVAGNKVWFKAGTYTITSASVNVAGGVLRDVVGGVDWSRPLWWEGYNASRGDKSATRPVFTLQNSLTTSPITIVDYEGSAKKYTVCDNIDVDAGTGNTQATGISLKTNEQILRRAKVSNTTVNGIVIYDQREYVEDVEVVGFSGTAGIHCGLFAADYSSTLKRFEIHDGSCTGLYCYQGPVLVVDGLIYDLSGGSSHGMVADLGQQVRNVTVDNVGAQGFYIVSRTSARLEFINCLAYGCGTYGWDSEAAESSPHVQLRNCAGGNNTSGNYSSDIPAESVENFIALSADPFVDRANDDYRLNTTAGGGAALRGVATIAFPRGLTTSYADIGAAQHQDAGGMLVHPGMSGGMRG